MQVFHHIASVREAVTAVRAQSKTIAFVPTMGNLHAGHLALVAQAKKHSGWVAVSIFVNRLQFGLNEDWDKYPRTLERDIEKLKAAGCDCLFCPDEHEIYPNGMDDQTRVIVPSMTDVLCGASRPGHFEGVTTVVSKLFNIVQPDVAVFGKKDFQQLAIIRRMAEDLCMPVTILGGEIEREADGLAMSSRNSFITTDERLRANQLNRSLSWVCDQIKGGRRDYPQLERDGTVQIEAEGFRCDYFKICETQSLESAADDDKSLVVLGAMFTQAARLIDNMCLELD
ncbi:MAG: pantoate--beta-alanine ligase [Flavobacteriales bacterium]|jgi:pantoate--beta-alanine ligase